MKVAAIRENKISDVERGEKQRNSFCTCEDGDCEGCCVCCGIFVRVWIGAA